MQGPMEPVTITVSSSVFDATAVRLALKAAEILRNEYGITALIDVDTSPTPFKLIDTIAGQLGVITVGNKVLVIGEDFEIAETVNNIIDMVLEHLAIDKTRASPGKIFFSPSNDGEGISGEYVLEHVEKEAVRVG